MLFGCANASVQIVTFVVLVTHLINQRNLATLGGEKSVVACLENSLYERDKNPYCTDSGRGKKGTMVWQELYVCFSLKFYLYI